MVAFNRKRFEELRPAIEERLEEFRTLPRSQWIREVLLCIFTPQSSPYNAEGAVTELEKRGYFSGKLREDEIAEILRDGSRYVRFHKTKAKRAVEFLGKANLVQSVLDEGLDPKKEREIFVREINGFGLKEASHALRNIGRPGLTILDRHILRNLETHKVIREAPKTLTPAKYLEIEDKFHEFALKLGENIDALDLFFWASETGTIFK